MVGETYQTLAIKEIYIRGHVSSAENLNKHAYMYIIYIIEVAFGQHPSGHTYYKNNHFR
jgi:hypothetical protein